ncbi:indole-3-acetic acid-amido synthetase gh3.6 [Nicotiana attenuata]|uniref:Indole-3-acetic acid-amido synthetase gh3.6 n=1 Tax=Nicotiana attenuata TaxID=49451 RepID=A0A1J6IMZ2_NICAT|nr:indole-3-acetic acid-amido synthetase gh3.6 [Nicotiana attenuata]
MPEAPSALSDYGSFDENNKKLFQFFENITTNADEVQKKVLNEILSRNAGVEYLQRHGLNGKTDYETFKKIMPVVTYEDLKPILVVLLMFVEVVRSLLKTRICLKLKMSDFRDTI